MTGINCAHCEAAIADDPEYDLEEGRIEEFVAHTVHPDDSIAVAKTHYYCDPECLAADVEVEA